jgi:hypothetical protein
MIRQYCLQKARGMCASLAWEGVGRGLCDFLACLTPPPNYRVPTSFNLLQFLPLIKVSDISTTSVFPFEGENYCLCNCSNANKG